MGIAWRVARIALAASFALLFGVVLFDLAWRVTLESFAAPWGDSLAIWLLLGASMSGPGVLVTIVLGEGSGERRAWFYVAMWSLAAAIPTVPLALLVPSPLIFFSLLSGAGGGAVYWVLAGRHSGRRARE